MLVYDAGVELFGSAEAASDIDVISTAHNALSALRLPRPVTLNINTLGDAATRATYEKQLVEYLESYRAALSADSVRR